ncbi:MAG: tRNA pseudouridine(38-40) synthase TruA [Balneolaceae bacterium]|nr:tRNA pseudouridine(38-40) synthase TruA [Balneolaceae bacterium]
MQETNRHKFIFEYDGTHFSGWQRQPDERTVQGVIEGAFSTLFQKEIKIAGQGRTDAGVHATGQAAHADLPVRFEEYRILHAMKGLLPNDVALLKAEKISPGFHARFDAVSRSYTYRLLERPSPLNRHFTWIYHGTLREDLLNESADKITGTHDFINFCIPSGDEYQTTECTITESFWEKAGEVLVYRIKGNRFLRHMVRRIVGTMVRVSEGKLRLDQFEKLLSGPESVQKGHTAPARGLVLESVEY